MKNIAIVNLMNVSIFFYEKIENKTQLERILKYSKNLPNVDEVLFLCTKDIEGVENKIIIPTWNEEIFIKEISKKCEKYDHLFYFFSDCPLLDLELSKSMFEDHINYYAEYTFADGFPLGLTPEIIDTNILSALQILSKDSNEPITRNTFFNIIKKDINSFELETRISDIDLRLLRVSLTTDTKRNFNQLLRVIELGGINSSSISDVLINHPEILIQEPSYVTIEITNKNIQEVKYLPKRTKTEEFINVDLLDNILKKIKIYSDDATIGFTPESEPTTHPELLNIIDLITNKYNFDLYIETSGLGWTKELLSEVKNNKRVHIIVTIDALNSEIYDNLRGNGLDEAINTTKNLIEYSKERVWVQATRMLTNETDMEPFYRYWQKYTDKIIIQKYSNYNGRLPNLKIADLSPLKRFPCWHLKRDIHINTIGEVLLCFYDINNERVLGSLVTEDIESIMERKKSIYIEHINCEYKNHCRECDEYYTFNF